MSFLVSSFVEKSGVCCPSSTLHNFKVVSISQKSNFILASVPYNLRTVPHAASTTPGQSDESDRLNLDELSLCVLVYCASKEIMAIAPVSLLLGWFVAGSINKTILETSTTAKECEVPWHLLGMALFFLLLKFLCPCQYRGVCLFISLFAIAGLWRMQ